MQSAASTLPGAMRPRDLAELFSARGPFASIYLTTEAAVEQAAQRSEQRWRAVRQQLADAGMPDDGLRAVDALVPDAHHEGECLALVATAVDVLHVEHHLDPPRRDMGRWAALPSVGPLLEWRQARLPYVIVLADRTGADIVVAEADRIVADREVGGREGPVTKSAPGGWSQRRFQQRAENTWEHNAAEAAAEVARLADRAGARLVALGGDVRAVQLFEEHLPSTTKPLVHHIDGSRATDGSIDAVARDVVRLVATAAARDTVGVLEKFREERGQHDRAADGPAATLAGLAQGQVDVLLVHDDPDDAREAWFGPEAVHVGLSADDVRGMGVGEPTSGRLVDVAIRAALGTSAGIRIVPRAGGPADSIGAILRWS
jgi:hypothetical protein